MSKTKKKFQEHEIRSKWDMVHQGGKHKHDKYPSRWIDEQQLEQENTDERLYETNE